MSELKIQLLMNEFYEFWQNNTDLTRLQVMNQFSELHQVSVRLGNLNYQVENGGFVQWEDNEYAMEDINSLLSICDKGIHLGIAEFKTLKHILLDYKNIPEFKHNNDTDVCGECSGDGEVQDYDDEDKEITVSCSECLGNGVIEIESDNDDERQSLFEKLDDKYFLIDNLVGKMNELIERWDEINHSEVQPYSVYQDQNVKPKCNLKGVDGNAFVIISHVRQTLNKAGLNELSEEFSKRAFKQKSYHDLLVLLNDYVEIAWH